MVGVDDVDVAAASTREAPLRRRCTQATGKQRLGQPFSLVRCRAMGFHQRSNGLATGPSPPAWRPRDGGTEQESSKCRGAQHLQSWELVSGLPKIFF